MPYVRCNRCALTHYSATHWSGPAECPTCGAPLPIPRRGAPQPDAVQPVERMGADDRCPEPNRAT